MVALAQATVRILGARVDGSLSYCRIVGDPVEMERLDLQACLHAVLRDLACDIADAGARIEVGAPCARTVGAGPAREDGGSRPREALPRQLPTFRHGLVNPGRRA